MTVYRKYQPLYLDFFRRYHAGEYWEAHEVLEELWQTERHNDFYHGLIQVAAIMHQLERGKVRGARKLAVTAIGYLTPSLPLRDEVDVAKVIEWLHGCLRELPEEPARVEPGKVSRLGLGICPLPQFC
ncbi:DUF309 domain-containing protein [Salinithrix halophila]|uniref:DUF309 domain-containing protein n=1 Tax=Salinithrix halophila TaxID=1485204 RepID=A0ABV8JF32_9BACL